MIMAGSKDCVFFRGLQKVPIAVTCHTQVACIERTPRDEVLVLATDGLWDVFSNKVCCGSKLKV
jgi:serine/threonine protein phosphatase PrpC